MISSISTGENMARPRKKVDEKLLEKLAYIHLDDTYIALCLGISKDTLHRRFADKISECRANGKAKLLSRAWTKVDSGDWSAIKFLLQNYLKLTDKIAHSVDGDSIKPIVLNYSPESLKKAAGDDEKNRG